MARPMLLFVLVILAGCGEAERPRFVPAASDAPAISPPDDRQVAGERSREASPLQKIPMH